MVTPYIEVLRPIPAVAWIPLAILMWPTEESSIIYITFLGALFPIILNTVHGVEQTPEVLVRAAQTLGASRMQIFWNVTLPAALPSIATGLAIGMGVSWFSLLAGEIISGQYGIGYFTWNAYSLIKYPDIVVGMLVIGTLGTLSTMAVRKLTQPLLSLAKEVAMSVMAARATQLQSGHDQAGAGRSVLATVRRHRGLILGFTFLFPVVFYLVLMGLLVVRFGHLPNYVTPYDWFGNVWRIVAGTGSVSDIFQIVAGRVAARDRLHELRLWPRRLRVEPADHSAQGRDRDGDRGARSASISR